MTGRIEKKELVRRFANRMGIDEKQHRHGLRLLPKHYMKTLKYEGMKVVLPGFGGFFVRWIMPIQPPYFDRWK